MRLQIIIKLILLLTLIIPAVAMAQTGATTGAIIGSVKDSQGAVIVGATITVHQLETNFTRSSQVDADGIYQIVQLPPGKYEVKVDAEGFSSQMTNLTLDIGRTELAKFTLSVSVEKEVIEVSASEMVNVNKTESSTNIDRQQIENLPINQRNFLDFTLTTAGVTPNRVPADGPTMTSGLSFHGQTARENNITIDGLDNNEPGAGSVRTTFSQDAVQEFQVVKANFSAEFGRALGGVVNIVTKGGSNEFHGSIFNFVRDDEISARDPFSSFKPDFRQYQFGGTLGGPIKKDKAFFFGSFERLTVQQNNIVTISNELIESARKLGFNEQNGPIPFSIASTQLLGRGDFQINANDRLTVRYNYGGEYNGNLQPFGGLRSETSGGLELIKDNNLAITNTKIFPGLNLINETRFLYAHRNFKVTPLDPAGPQVSIFAPEGQVFIGRDPLLPQATLSDFYEIIDNVSLDRKNHQIKTGLDFLFYRVPQGEISVPVLFGGDAIFAPVDFSMVLQTPGLPSFTAPQFFDPSLRTPAQQTFLLGAEKLLPSLFPGFPNNVPLTTLPIPLAYLQGFGNPVTSAAVNYLSAYVQDDYRVKPNLLIKAGLRYDRESIRFAPTNDGDFSPRIGFNYQPARLERLNISAAYGIFHGTNQFSIATVSKLLNGNTVVTPNLPFPFSILPFALPGHHFPEGDQVPAGVTVIPQLARTTTISPNLRSGYAQQANLAINYLVNNSTTISFEYQYIRGIKILLARNINPVVRPILQNPTLSEEMGRVDPNKGEVISFESDGDSYYNGATISISSRYKRHFTLLAHYTVSKAIDDYVDALRVDILTQQDPLNLRGERSLSLQDVHSRFVLSSTYDSGRTRNFLIRDLQFSSIITINSGQPFNLLAGSDLDGNGDNAAPADRPDRIGRNAGIGPGFASVDIRASRSFAIGERVRIAGYLEAFNLFNRLNIDKVNAVFPPNPDGTFSLPPKQNGMFIATPDRYVSAFRPRQFQLGIRMTF